MNQGPHTYYDYIILQLLVKHRIADISDITSIICVPQPGMSNKVNKAENNSIEQNGFI